MKEIHALLQKFGNKIYTGGAFTISLAGISITDIVEGVFRIMLMIISIAVGVVTFRYTQEKRRFLKEQRQEAVED